MVLIVVMRKGHDETGIGDAVHLFPRKSLSGREVRRTSFNSAGMTHETLFALLLLCGFKLLTNQPADGNTRCARSFF